MKDAISTGLAISEEEEIAEMNEIKANKGKLDEGIKNTVFLCLVRASKAGT